MGADPRFALSAVNPAQAETVAEFATLLDLVRKRSGKTFDELSRWALGNGNTLAKSTLSELFKGRRLPSDRHMVSILLACGLTLDALEPWKQTRARLATPGADIVLVKRDFDEKSRDLRSLLAEAREEVDSLKARETNLSARLANEEAKCRKLEAELHELRAQMSLGDTIAANVVQREQDLASLHAREREHIASMRSELTLVSDARRRAEHHAELASAASDELEQTGRVIDLMELQFKRAQHEQQQREQLTDRLQQAQGRVSELERILSGYQYQLRSEPPPPVLAPSACTCGATPTRASWWRRLFSGS